MERNRLWDIANTLILQIQSKAAIIKVEQIVDKELDKTYDVYCITTQLGDRYILKHALDGYESRLYSDVFAEYNLPMPEYFGHTKDLRGDLWFLCKYLTGEDIRSEDLSIYNLAIKQLAQVHKTYWDFNHSSHSFVKNKNVYLEKQVSSIEEYKWELHENILCATNVVIDRLTNRPQTIIHNDLLPINIINDNNEVKIIDWGSAALGCYAHDLGRLLGDLKNEDMDYWVKPEWRQSLLDTYYMAMNEFSNESLSWSDLLFDYHCARFYNYLSIVSAHLKNNWTLSQWYQVNLMALTETANRIVSGYIDRL